MSTSPKPSTNKSASAQRAASVKPHVCSSTFTHNGQDVTVTMTVPLVDPSGKSIPILDVGTYSGGEIIEVNTPKGRSIKREGMTWTPPKWSKIWDTPPKDFTEPVEILGNYCPSTFRVDGLAYEITFRIGHGQDGPVVITSISIGGEDIDRKSLGSLPMSNFLDHAINASTFTATAYPPNYTTTLDNFITYESGPLGGIRIDRLGGRRTLRDIRDMKGEKPRGRHKAGDAWNSVAMIERVSTLWHSTPDDFVGGRLRYIQEKLEFIYHDSVVSKIIGLARDEGLIPKVNRRHKYPRGRRK